MKLRNKKTGEIVEATDFNIISEYNSLAELNAEWEDYEKPKDFWFVDSAGEVQDTTYVTDYDKTNLRKFGNYFETKEEAEKAAEKLKAWKRLKYAGFKFKEWKHTPLMDTVDGYKIHIEAYTDKMVAVMKDLDLLFGGEE